MYHWNSLLASLAKLFSERLKNKMVGNKPLLMVDPMCSRRWPTQKELNGILEVLCLIMFVLGHFFKTLQVHCIHSIASGFVFLWDSCMCECVCISAFMYFLCFFFGSFSYMSVYFLTRDRKSMDLDGGWEGTGRSWGRRKHNQNILYEKNIF